MAECLHRTIAFPRALKGIRVRGDADAEARRENDLRDAYQRGYDFAVTEIHEKVNDQRQQLANLQDHTLRRLAEQEKTLFEELQNALPDLVIDGVRRVLAEVELARPLVEGIVREILEAQAFDREGLVIVLSPRDCELVEGLRGELNLSYPNIEFRPDESLQSGDCLVHSRFGVTDARIETKIKNLRSAIE